MPRPFALVVALVVATLVGACQKPTDPDDTVDVDDFLEIAVAPNPALADASTDGKTYRVVRGNNQPDEILVYDWKTFFTLTLTLNSQADDDDVLEFPVDLTQVTVQVKQASGGIVTPPSGGEIEYYTSVPTASGNRFAGINTSNAVSLDVWYDLPSLRKEALATVTLSFKDNDGQTFSKAYDVRIAP